MGERWCTVTVIEESGRRHSLDVLASSTFDAAHIFVTHAMDRLHADGKSQSAP